MTNWIRNLAFVALVAFSGIAASQPAFLNSGFESPAIGPGSFQPGFSGSSWTGEQYMYFAGISGHGTWVTQFNPAPPQGSQVAFLSQGYNVRQTIWMEPGSYYLSVKAASGPDYTGTLGQPAGLRIIRNSNQMIRDGLFPGGAYSYQPYNSDEFVVTTAGNQTFAFISTGSGILLLDDVAIVSNNTLPVVSVTSPANGQTFVVPASVTLTASASDGDGIQSVQFFNNGTNAISSQITSPPYTIEWSDLAPGNYSITAKAIDAYGGATVSAPVVFVVTEVVPQMPPVTLSRASTGVWTIAGISPVAITPPDVVGGFDQYSYLEDYAPALGQRLFFEIAISNPDDPGNLFRSNQVGHVVVGLNHRYTAGGNRFGGMLIGNACGPTSGIGLEWKHEDGTTLIPGAGAPACIGIPIGVTIIRVDLTVYANGCIDLTAYDGLNPSPFGSLAECRESGFTSPFAGIGVGGLAGGPPSAAFDVYITPLQRNMVYQ